MNPKHGTTMVFKATKTKAKPAKSQTNKDIVKGKHPKAECIKYKEGFFYICVKSGKNINPVHSFRHSRAVDMLYSGHPITDIKNHLGHENIQSTTIYLHLDLNRRRHIQKRFIRYMQSVLTDDSKIEELLHWENEGDLMQWLDSL